MVDPAVSNTTIDLISSLGLMGVGAYLVYWITRNLEQRQQEAMQRSDEASKRHEESLKMIYNSLEKVGDKYGELISKYGDLRDCYIIHDAQAKAIRELGISTESKMIDVEKHLADIKEICRSCRIGAK